MRVVERVLVDEKFSLSPGCGHCQNAKPKYKEAAEVFRDDPNKAFATVDCTVDGGKCSVSRS